MSQIYVDAVNGLDTNDGLSAATPIKTISKLNDLLKGNGIHWWRLDEPAGVAKVRDSANIWVVGYTVTNATLGNTNTATVGKTSAAFNGSNAQISASEDPNGTTIPPASSFTVGGWVKNGNLAQTNAYVMARTSAGGQMAILFGYVAGKYEFYASGNTGSDPRTNSGITPPDDGWHHIAWTYDGTTWTKWLDGDPTVINANITFGLKTNGGGGWYIGSAGGSGYFNGYMQDWRVYGVALDADGIAEMMDADGSITGITEVQFAAGVYDTDEPLVVSGCSPGVSLTADALGDAIITGTAIISPTNWTQLGTSAANVFWTDDVSQYCVLWESDEAGTGAPGKWLQHIKSTNTAIADLQSALQATPGCFWVAGGTNYSRLYVHPFGSTDPRTDGKEYRRSTLLTSKDRQLIEVGCRGAQLLNLKAWGTALVSYDHAIPSGGWTHYVCMASPIRGNHIISNCEFSHGHRHVFGSLDGDTNGTLTLIDVAANQACPHHLDVDNSDNWVFYTDTSGFNGTNMTVSLTRCTTTANLGSTNGSTAGTTLYGGQTYAACMLAHSPSTNRRYLFTMNDCDLVGNISLDDCVSSFSATNTQAFNFAGRGFTYQLNRCKTTGKLPHNTSNGTNLAELGVAATDCIFGTVQNAATNPSGIWGTVSYTRCTFDLSQIPGWTAGDEVFAPTTTNASSVTISGCALRMPTSASALYPFSFNASDTLVFRDNVYQLQGGTNSAFAIFGGTNKTYTQWLSLGKDTNSASVADLLIDSQYRPRSGSPLIRHVLSYTDYAGTAFGIDAGAVQTGTGASLYVTTAKGVFRRRRAA